MLSKELLDFYLSTPYHFKLWLRKFSIGYQFGIYDLDELNGSKLNFMRYEDRINYIYHIGNLNDYLIKTANWKYSERLNYLAFNDFDYSFSYDVFPGWIPASIQDLTIECFEILYFSRGDVFNFNDDNHYYKVDFKPSDIGFLFKIYSDDDEYVGEGSDLLLALYDLMYKIYMQWWKASIPSITELKGVVGISEKGGKKYLLCENFMLDKSEIAGAEEPDSYRFGTRYKYYIKSIDNDIRYIDDLRIYRQYVGTIGFIEGDFEVFVTDGFSRTKCIDNIEDIISAYGND